MSLSQGSRVKQECTDYDEAYERNLHEIEHGISTFLSCPKPSFVHI